MEQDIDDAMALQVTATPEHFVNGRRLPSVGRQQLLNLVQEELQSACRSRRQSPRGAQALHSAPCLWPLGSTGTR